MLYHFLYLKTDCMQQICLCGYFVLNWLCGCTHCKFCLIYSVSTICIWFYLFMSCASFALTLLFLAFVLPSNYSLGVNAGFATMFILIILLVVLGLWTKATNNSIMWFVVENFEVSIAIAGVSVVAICGLSFVLSNLFSEKIYIVRSKK